MLYVFAEYHFGAEPLDKGLTTSGARSLVVAYLVQFFHGNTLGYTERFGRKHPTGFIGELPNVRKFARCRWLWARFANP